MANSVKDWLVRTRSGQIIGPFTQLALVEEMRRQVFTAEDEIAPSKGHWVSAQGLSHRDLDEVTRTSTRSEAARVSHRLQVHVIEDEDEEDLTPTPDFKPGPVGSYNTSVSIERPTTSNLSPENEEPEISERSPRFALVVIAITVIVGLWIFVLNLHPKAKSDHNPLLQMPNSNESMEDKAPAVREAYDLIRQGKNQEALKKLTEYHTRGPAKGDVDYLIPYSALLVQENESIPRAKKLLEGLLDSTDASPKVKAKAHHWLGYILLSQNQGDMGESQFLEALELNPKEAATRFNLGRAYLKQNKFQQALDYLQLAELEAPDLWIVHIYKGRARMSLGQLEDARASFVTAVDKSPERWMSYIYFALYELGAHDSDEAQATLRRMLTHDPNFETNSAVPFGFFQEKVDYTEYLDAYVRVTEKAPAGEGKELGKLYLNYILHGPPGPEGKRIEALAEMGNLTAKVLAIKVALDREATTEELQKAVQRAAGNLDGFGYYAYVLRGMAKTRLGDDTNADQDFEKALLMEPKAAITHWSLANLLKKQHRDSEARSEMNRLLSYHPDYLPAIVSVQNF
jgi:tetratricopeptide (TPR) repeat protein